MPTKLSQGRFREWLAEITNNKQHELIDYRQGENKPGGGWSETIRIYTHDYSYQIIAEIDIPTMGHSYLGCTMSVRKPRAGEDWSRGHDLPDGPCNRLTWDRIKNAIINNELVKVSKARRSSGDANCSDIGSKNG